MSRAFWNLNPVSLLLHVALNEIKRVGLHGCLERVLYDCESKGWDMHCGGMVGGLSKLVISKSKKAPNMFRFPCLYKTMLWYTSSTSFLIIENAS